MSGPRRVREIAGGFSFLEAPRWHGGRLYASDFYSHRVLSFDAAGGMEVICEVPGQPSGLGFAPDGSLLVVSMTDRKLLRHDGHGLSVVADLSELAPFHANDMLVGPAGDAYIGNFGWDSALDPVIQATCLIHVDPAGNASVAAEGLCFPNGMVAADDGGTLLVCETFASRITQFDRDADGRLTNRRVWADLGDGASDTVLEAVEAGRPLPDGMTLDAEGAVWIGDAAGRGPLRVAAGGQILDAVDTGDLAVFAVALGGPDGRTLFMCASPPLLANDPSRDRDAVLLACEVEVPAYPVRALR